MTISSQVILLAAERLLLSQKRNFSNNHPARVPVTPNQQGMMGMRDEVLSGVGAQDMDTSGYRVSADLDDVEFYWENDQLDVDAVFRQWIGTPFSRSTFNIFEISSMGENPILIGEEQDKERFPPPHRLTPVSERPTEIPVLRRSRPFGTRCENVPDYVDRKLFE